MKRSERLILGAILLCTGVIFVPTKAESLLLGEADYQAQQTQHSPWQSACLNIWFQTGKGDRKRYLNFFPVSAAAATGLLWHRFSLVTPQVVTYWLVAARRFKCC